MNFTEERIDSDNSKHLVEKICRDIDRFLSADCSVKSVLLFPPLNAFIRYLIHSVTDEKYSDKGLHTFSIGENTRKRVVLCYVKDMFHPNYEEQHESKFDSQSNTVKDVGSDDSGVSTLASQNDIKTDEIQTNGCDSSKQGENGVTEELKEDQPKGEESVPVSKKINGEENQKNGVIKHSENGNLTLECYHCGYQGDVEIQEIHKEDNTICLEIKASADLNPNENNCSVPVTNGDDKPKSPDRKINSKPNKRKKSEKVNFFDDQLQKLKDMESSLSPSEIQELVNKVGAVKIIVSKENYYEVNHCDNKQGSIVELYGFDEKIKTADLIELFKSCVSKRFNLKRVDNSHALILLQSPLVAKEILSIDLPNLKTRPLSEATEKSQNKAKHVFQPPSKPKPKIANPQARRGAGARRPSGDKRLAPKIEATA